MEKFINILDKDYVQWVKELSLRYRQSQIRSAVKVNQEMLRFLIFTLKTIVCRWQKHATFFLKSKNNDNFLMYND